jgi:hypothetical protein
VSDQVPRKRIEPLAPPPGQFDRVMSEARYRRHRRAMAMLTVAFVFVAGLGGGLALGKDTPRELYAALSQQDGKDSGGQTPTTTSTANKNSNSPTSKSTRKTTKTVLQPTPAATKLSDPARGKLAFRGQAVGPAGQPAAGLYVYVGIPGARGFEPAGWSIGRTDNRGRFSMACPHAPILLAPWPIMGEAKAKARNVAWSATFVGGTTDPEVAEEAPCSRGGTRDQTRIGRGSAVEGTVTMPPQCKLAVQSLRLWLHNDPATYVKVQDLEDGDSFRVSGLPAGQHTLDAKGNLVRVLVGGGETAHQDVTFTCVGDPMPIETPTTAAPTDTSTSIATHLPTETSSGSPTGDPSASATP